jgi:hypothetical protein
MSKPATKVILYGDDSVCYPDGTLGTNKILYTYTHSDEVLDAENDFNHAIYGHGPYGYDENSTVGGDSHNEDDYPYTDNPTPDTDNELSQSVYPDSYFTMKFMNVDYNVPDNPLVGGRLNVMCNPKYEVVDTADDEIAVSNDTINSSPILLNAIETHSHPITNLFNAPLRPRTTPPVFTRRLLARMLISAARRFTTNLTDRNNLIACAKAIADSTINDVTASQFWTRAKLAKLFIAETTNVLNVKKTNAQQTLASGTATASASPTTTVSFKVIDAALMTVYAKALRFLENGIAGGRVPVTKNATSGDRGTKNETVTIPSGQAKWINYAYPDSKGLPTLGFGHLIIGGFTTMSIPLSPNNPYIGTPNVSNPITGFWQKPTKTFKTLVNEDQKGVTDEELVALFAEDLSVHIKLTQDALGVKRWNYLYDNDQCLLLVCIDIQFNTGNLRSFTKLLTGDGNTNGIGSGMGLQIKKLGFSHFINVNTGKYSYDLWTKPSTYNGTQAQYIVEKKAELKKESHRKSVGAQRNDAIYQLFIDKDKFSFYAAARGPPVNYWTKCNPDNIDLKQYQKYNN